MLLERQKKSGAFGLNRLNPLDEFSLTSTGLEFTNLSEKYGLETSVSTYQAQWGIYDNSTGSRRDEGTPVTTLNGWLKVPTLDLSGVAEPYLTVAIRTENQDLPKWDRIVLVYLRAKGGGHEIVGIDRESTPSLPPQE